MATAHLLSLPKDILVLLPEYLHNIEDYISLSSTCRILRDCMRTATPNTILRLAAAHTKIFFRPSPHFFVAATARELGNWARRTNENEQKLDEALRQGIDGIYAIALQRCGLTLERIRHLYEMRFEVINPVVDIIDKCVGEQWYSIPRFWEGGCSDAATIHSDPEESVFHLAIYGELFAPDLETFIDQESSRRMLDLQTRLAYITYCVPDHSIIDDLRTRRRSVEATGPYTRRLDLPPEFHQFLEYHGNDNSNALGWVLKSSTWRPHWRAMREAAGCEDFDKTFKEEWSYARDRDGENDWKQRLWENVMICQGLEGLEMIRPAKREQWTGKVMEWRAKIDQLERQPDVVEVGRQNTHEYAHLMGDLRVCAHG